MADRPLMPPTPESERAQDHRPMPKAHMHGSQPKNRTAIVASDLLAELSRKTLRAGLLRNASAFHRKTRDQRRSRLSTRADRSSSHRLGSRSVPSLTPTHGRIEQRLRCQRDAKATDVASHSLMAHVDFRDAAARLSLHRAAHAGIEKTAIKVAFPSARSARASARLLSRISDRSKSHEH